MHGTIIYILMALIIQNSWNLRLQVYFVQGAAQSHVAPESPGKGFKVRI